MAQAPRGPYLVTDEFGRPTDPNLQWEIERPLNDLNQPATQASERKPHGVYFASDEKDVNAAKSAAGRIERRNADQWRKLLHTVDGRAFVFDKLAAMYAFETPFIAGYPDLTAYRLGVQSVGLTLLAEVQLASADLYLKMISEFNTRRKDADAK